MSFDKMKRLLPCLAVAAALTIGSAHAEPSKVIAVVNGVDIYQSEYDLAAEMMGAELGKLSPEQKKETIMNVLTETLLLSQAADKAASACGRALGGLAGVPESRGVRDSARQRLRFGAEVFWTGSFCCFYVDYHLLVTDRAFFSQ